MNDMLVKLYTLPPLESALTRQTEQGITVRRGLAPEKHVVLAWIKKEFRDHWVSEADVGFSRQPPTVWVATLDAAPVGFACWDTTARGFFGPIGVSDSVRGRGTGAALLLAALHDMRAHGYVYAIIGAAGPVTFYERVCGATVIPDSSPGGYADMLR